MTGDGQTEAPGKPDSMHALHIRDSIQRLEAHERESAERSNELRRKLAERVETARQAGLSVEFPGEQFLAQRVEGASFGIPTIYRRQIL